MPAAAQTREAAQRQRDVAQATAYVRRRFYPPLPAEYGELAVDAVARAREDGPDAELILPPTLNPVPRSALPHDEGWTITAAAFLSALKLDHLLEA